ncbi:MAG TPA: PP0621 family protein [Burkholderiaceae bacterium]|nr:PP0621 family protein [Burkholderiaceae bacterium]
MKFLLLLVAVFVLLWLLRGSLQRARRPPSAPKPGAEAPQPMLSCAHCGLHLPRDEALPGRGGVFCGAAHRAAYEQAHPDS